MTTLLIATRNQHKVGEIRVILGDRFHYLTLADFPSAPAIVEDAPTFAGNALNKATELAAWFVKQPASPADRAVLVLADDSGLEVDALDGSPGVHSARFASLDAGAGPTASGNSPDADNNAKLLQLLADVPVAKRSARFRCVIAIARLGGVAPEVFDGACEGRIEYAARGQGGFGYDPLFVPSGFDRSFAELGEQEKNRISHRATALASVGDWLKVQVVD